MLSTIAQLSLHLILLTQPAGGLPAGLDVIHPDPGFYLVLANPDELQSLKDHDVPHRDLGLWRDLYPAAVISTHLSGYTNVEDPIATQNGRYLIRWDRDQPPPRGHIAVLPMRGVPPFPERPLRASSPADIPFRGASFFPSERFESYLRQVSGEDPFLFQGQEIALYSRSYDLMTRADHTEAMAVEYLYITLQSQGYAPEVLPFAVPYCGAHFNVAVTVPGWLYPDEEVYVTAHFDDRPFSGRAPGADDNGTGTASMLVISEMLRCLPPQRTIRLVWVSAEEVGLCGSRGLLESMDTTRRSNIVADINGDMFGYDGNGDGYVPIHAGLMSGSRDLGQIFADAAVNLGLPLDVEVLTHNAIAASDHSSFWIYGIPAIEIGEDFFYDSNPAYHRSGDKISAMHLDYATAIGTAMAATVLSVANPDPGFYPRTFSCFDRMNDSKPAATPR
ncbi:MAG TPA: M28 family metallopeptidase [Thermoanaerobaculia bacterium]|nr:M28 family metallopeptidase [Thermoanaerobaculia bacterium]HUM30550.1 M28 family metallopeptidase [Thermoanaerobaculia bacterium]HXK68742.1 M28 family metallopeptidase [Thermoanaerobaculia bacterium]